MSAIIAKGWRRAQLPAGSRGGLVGVAAPIRPPGASAGRARRRPSAGFTVLEIMVVVAIVSILAAIGLVQVSRARIAAREQLAVSNLRSISKACHLYFLVHDRYPDTLAKLGPGDPSADPPHSDPPYRDPSLTQDAPLRQGYAFSSGSGASTVSLCVRPTLYGNTGVRSFLADQSSTIHYTDEDRPAMITDPAVS